MSVLRNLEAKLSALVEGTFSRAFKSEVRPLEIAHKLTREMDEHKVKSLSRTYAPNEYVVWLSTEDREQFSAYETELAQELSGYLLEHSRSERIALLTRPTVEFRTDKRLRLGEFGIQARLVRPTDDPADQPSQGDHGHTMVYSAAALKSERSPVSRQVAWLRFEGRGAQINPTGALVGRSRDCDIVLSDPNVSRRHAKIRRSEDSWVLEDLASTNGVKLNGRRIDRSHPLISGDEIEFGTAITVFELE